MDLQINPEHLAQFLKQQNLLIVSKDEFLNKIGYEQTALMHKQKALLKQFAIKYKDIIDYKLLPLTAKTSIDDWVRAGKIKPGEMIKDSKGVKHVLSGAIKRLNPNL